MPSLPLQPALACYFVASAMCKLYKHVLHCLHSVWGVMTGRVLVNTDGLGPKLFFNYILLNLQV